MPSLLCGSPARGSWRASSGGRGASGGPVTQAHRTSPCPQRDTARGRRPMCCSALLAASPDAPAQLGIFKRLLQDHSLGASCCRTCRRLCAKYGRPLEVPCCRMRRRRRARNRLRERDTTRRRRAVPTAAPRTRAPPAPATARPPPPPPTEIRRIYEADRRATPALPRAPKPSGRAVAVAGGARVRK